MDDDVALCVGGPQYLVVTDGQCRYADSDEYEFVIRHSAADLEDVLLLKHSGTGEIHDTCEEFAM